MPLSAEARSKLSAKHLGKSHSLETRLLMSETRKGSNNPMFGKELSLETKNKLSVAKQGILHPNFGKTRSAEIIHLMRVNHSRTMTVYQYTSDKKTFVAKFDSIRMAAQLTGICRNHISLCIKQGRLVQNKWFFSLTPLT